MVGRFFYYLLNVFFTIVPLNMLFRIFPSEKRKSRDVYLASIFYAIFFLWMLPVPTAIASRYTMIFIYPFTAFNMFFFLGGSKSFKFILFCLYFNVLMLIEATSSLILSLIGLLFPGLHITGIFVAFEGNDISISLLCTIEMIVYLIIFSFVIRFISTHAYLLRLSLLISLLLPILLPMILNNIFTILSQNSLPTYIYLIPALSSHVKRNYPDTYCKNILLNTLLQEKKFLADQLDVTCNFKIILPEHFEEDFSDFTITSIFSNLLDNALESCKQYREHHPQNDSLFIHLSTDYKTKMFMIQMKNSKDPDIPFTRQSTKDDSTLHGHGLSIIGSIAKDYGGTCQWSVEDDSFLSLIMLKHT